MYVDMAKPEQLETSRMARIRRRHGHFLGRPDFVGGEVRGGPVTVRVDGKSAARL